MNMISDFRRLFSYDAWANQEVLASLKKLANPPDRSVALLGHILSAERLWLERIEARPQSLPVWPNLTLHQCEKEAADLINHFRKYFDGKPEAALSINVTYTNSKGETFTSQAHDILMHVIMHSVYHRGQIATDMRAAGFEPAYTDFIHCVRQGLIE